MHINRKEKVADLHSHNHQWIIGIWLQNIKFQNQKSKLTPFCVHKHFPETKNTAVQINILLKNEPAFT